MSSMSKSLQNVFAKNRAEELGLDVWQHFVIPPFFDSLDLVVARKPRVIMGGRGCGKTMLLRYLSHYSTFSPDRDEIPETAAKQIGIYWKADTQFAAALSGRGLDETEWIVAFGHEVALRLAVEILRSLENIAKSKCQILNQEDLTRLRFDKLAAFDDELRGNVNSVLEALEKKCLSFRLWSNNIRKVQQPVFFPAREFLKTLIDIVGHQVSSLQKTIYMVYIDEYENLCEYQQKIINTYLKHSEPPLIFNVAVKRNALRDRRTLGPESISDIADFRTHDIEEYLKEEFPIFAAEILFLHLSMANVNSIPINVEDLRDPAALQKRKQREYKEAVFNQARKMFPEPSLDELGQTVFDDAFLHRRLRDEIQEALKKRSCKLSVETFFRPEHARATIVSSALLNRPRNDPEQIKKEFDKLEKSEENRFTGPTNWIHNNFVGCLLHLYNVHSKVCPFYAGFDTFCHLSRGNLRHFLELCNKSTKQCGSITCIADLKISPQDQAHAARQASSAFLREIRACGRLGNRLYAFVMTLGSLFTLAHQRKTQSEPEVCHFAITKGASNLTDHDTDFLREAVKWSVIFEERETKVKDSVPHVGRQWVLNPIYAPYFLITYRKRRKLDLTVDDVIVLIRGSYDERRELLKRFQVRWSIGSEEIVPTLFSNPEGD